jgi:hypothetical protein
MPNGPASKTSGPLSSRLAILFVYSHMNTTIMQIESIRDVSKLPTPVAEKRLALP